MTLVSKHACWLLAHKTPRINWSNEQVAFKRPFLRVFIEITGFCDVGITLHNKLAICLLLLIDQSGEWITRHWRLLQVNTKRIEDICMYHFELSFGNTFFHFLQINGKLCLILHAMLTFKKEIAFEALYQLFWIAHFSGTLVRMFSVQQYFFWC